MELEVVGSHGVPKDSLLSIRAGSTRRQATLATLDKPFKFPCKPDECGAIKVDVLWLLGSARALCKSEESMYELQLETAPNAADISVPEEMDLSFIVKATGDDDSKPSSKHTTLRSTLDFKAHKPAHHSTEVYLERHNLLIFLQSILQSLIREMPDDPYAFVSAQFIAKAPPAKGEPMPTDFLESTISVAEAALQNQLQELKMENKKLQEELEASKNFSSGQESGKQEQDLKDYTQLKAEFAALQKAFEELQKQYQSLLDENAQLKSALSGKSVATAEVDGNENDFDQGAERTQGSIPVEELRQRAHASLLQAAVDGKLEKVMQGRINTIPAEQPSKDSGDNKQVNPKAAAARQPSVPDPAALEKIQRFRTELSILAKDKTQLRDEVWKIQRLITRVDSENNKIREGLPSSRK
eukprot:gnl/TRDRNA2_/TRDRNA2_184687_c0_seq1.p1 gnl/TRDRNA2_/TRDRNA2_184687_c0~~gnl/TRDRNA2_/TRDRNA2_184687_c0_seq1.p1  ORF type:complete len:434 (+),score=105.86 gnl/TRDRNA2_/TRDRNA2_184687_c0_seq1:65-1303(+)